MKISHWTDAFKALPEAAQKAKGLFSSTPEAPAPEESTEAAAPAVTVEMLEAHIQALGTHLDKVRETLALQQSDQQGVAAQLRQLAGEQAQLSETLGKLRKRTGYLFIFSTVMGLIAVASLVIVLMRSGLAG